MQAAFLVDRDSLAVVVDSSAEQDQVGLVLRVNSGNFIVHAEEQARLSGITVQCTLRGNLRKKLTYSTSGSQPRRVTKAKQPFDHDSVAVGDRVRFRRDR